MSKSEKPKRGQKGIGFYPLTILICCVVLIGLSWKDTFSLIKNSFEIRTLSKELVSAQEQTKNIEKEIELLKNNDKWAWEKLLREELGALKPNEVEYRIK
ncbi:septum formation initiator family protein [Elusimicrobiota bacterium]